LIRTIARLIMTLYTNTSTFKRLQPLYQPGAGECNLHQHLPKGFSLYIRICGYMRPGSPYPVGTLRLHNLRTLFPALEGWDKQDPEARAEFCPWTTDSVSTLGSIVVLFACCDNTLLVCNLLCIRTPLLWPPFWWWNYKPAIAHLNFFKISALKLRGLRDYIPKSDFLPAR